MQECRWVAANVAFVAGATPAAEVLYCREVETGTGCAGGCPDVEAVSIELQWVVSREGE